MNPLSSNNGSTWIRAPLPLLMAGVMLTGACRWQSSSSAPSTIRLVDGFQLAEVTDQPAIVEPIPATEWRGPQALQQWQAVSQVRLAVSEERLQLDTRGDVPLIRFSREQADGPDDVLQAVEIRLSASGGNELAMDFLDQEDFDLDGFLVLAQGAGSSAWPLRTPILPDGKMRTYTLTPSAAVFRSSLSLSTWRHLVVRPTNRSQARVEIEWVRLISRRQHLQNVSSGIGFHGFSDIFRESLVSRAPERIRFSLTLPERAWLDLAVGTFEDGPVTFRVGLEEGTRVHNLLERTVSTSNRWLDTGVDLEAYAGRSVVLQLQLQGDPGKLGLWGSPVIRSSHRPSAAIDGPQGVILILGDTLRADHLESYGYRRATSPNLARMASQGALFADTQAQASWTKVSVPSILTSLYPTTHGIVDITDRLSASAHTAAELFQQAGFATWTGSSVPFSGQQSNLHQGVEVLHERGSIPEPGSKTTRALVKRLIPWIEARRNTPFFAFLHAFDPHAPYEPRPPYDTLWTTPERKKRFLKRANKVKPYIQDPLRRLQGFPRTEEIEASGVEAGPLVQFEKDWYDGSIRGMDAEIGTLLQALESMGLKEKTLIAFLSDHGEEFLEHGSHSHGNTVYGEMTNIPMFFYWPGKIDPGRVIRQTVQSIDLLPTLLELSGLGVPETFQGRSLAPVLTDEEAELEPMPAFSERFRILSAPESFPTSDSYAVVENGWKLIHNVRPAEGAPEFELFEHARDPLNLNDLASTRPDLVARLSDTLRAWQEAALAVRLQEADQTQGLSQQELERLRSLGYIR